MSSSVGAGDGLPEFSCTLGPEGTRGSAGAAPREAGTVVQTTAVLSSSQSHGSPAVALRRSAPDTSFACPLATSATHNSIPFGFVFVNDRYLPLGENSRPPTSAAGGSATFLSAPPAIGFREIPTPAPIRCWRPFVLGFIRAPARR